MQEKQAVKGIEQLNIAHIYLPTSVSLRLLTETTERAIKYSPHLLAAYTFSDLTAELLTHADF